jgi:hypothetical protein
MRDKNPLSQSCKTCSAFYQTPEEEKDGSPTGACRAHPPNMFMVGMREMVAPPPPVVMLNQPPPQVIREPMFAGSFVQMLETGWCREWDDMKKYLS